MHLRFCLCVFGFDLSVILSRRGRNRWLNLRLGQRYRRVFKDRSLSDAFDKHLFSILFWNRNLPATDETLLWCTFKAGLGLLRLLKYFNCCSTIWLLTQFRLQYFYFVFFLHQKGLVPLSRRFFFLLFGLNCKQLYLDGFGLLILLSGKFLSKSTRLLLFLKLAPYFLQICLQLLDAVR